MPLQNKSVVISCFLLQILGFCYFNLTRTTKFKYGKKNDEIILVSVVKHFIAQMVYYNYNYFFLSLRAGGILQILQSAWFRERAVFYYLTRAESLAASFKRLFVVCERETPVIFSLFCFKPCAIISVS